MEPDQTGFIPGRLIQTNISTVRNLIDYTEETTGLASYIVREVLSVRERERERERKRERERERERRSLSLAD